MLLLWVLNGVVMVNAEGDLFSLGVLKCVFQVCLPPLLIQFSEFHFSLIQFKDKQTCPQFYLKLNPKEISFQYYD